MVIQFLSQKCYSDCPCYKNCPLGCPCPTYPGCPTDAANNILVVYHWNGNLPVMLDDLSGEVNPSQIELLNFIILGELKKVDQFQFEEGAGSLSSCSVTIHGQMLIFGGGYNSYKTQISTVESCRLRRLGTLPMDFNWGGCNTFETSDGTEEALLCFDYYGRKQCHR